MNQKIALFIICALVSPLCFTCQDPAEQNDASLSIADRESWEAKDQMPDREVEPMEITPADQILQEGHLIACGLTDLLLSGKLLQNMEGASFVFDDPDGRGLLDFMLINSAHLASCALRGQSDLVFIPKDLTTDVSAISEVTIRAAEPNLNPPPLASGKACVGCLVNHICWDDGEICPWNVCQICDVEQSTTAWSANDGVSCDDQFFCNGEDVCAGGQCEHDGNPCPDDGLWCTGLELCDEGNGRCLNIDVPHCGDDGFWCNGTEFCNENQKSCDHANMPDCMDDGLFCNGAETCDETNDKCITTGDPCAPDGLFCNGVESCKENTDTCAHTGNPCPDDGLWCNGYEFCDEGGQQCLNTGYPCPGMECLEDYDQCFEVDDDTTPVEDDDTTPDDDVNDDDQFVPDDDDITPDDDSLGENSNDNDGSQSACGC